MLKKIYFIAFGADGTFWHTQAFCRFHPQTNEVKRGEARRGTAANTHPQVQRFSKKKKIRVKRQRRQEPTPHSFHRRRVIFWHWHFCLVEKRRKQRGGGKKGGRIYHRLAAPGLVGQQSGAAKEPGERKWDWRGPRSRRKEGANDGRRRPASRPTSELSFPPNRPTTMPLPPSPLQTAVAAASQP